LKKLAKHPSHELEITLYELYIFHVTVALEGNIYIKNFYSLFKGGTISPD
jgi:hypothetical protein